MLRVLATMLWLSQSPALCILVCVNMARALKHQAMTCKAGGWEFGDHSGVDNEGESYHSDPLAEYLS